MTSDEIKETEVPSQQGWRQASWEGHRDEYILLWLKEIAYQLAIANERE